MHVSYIYVFVFAAYFLINRLIFRRLFRNFVTINLKG